MTIDQKLSALRAVMNQNQVDAIIIPTVDPHQSEYIAACWQERAWISGFNGSAGWVVVTAGHAGLWTDSRYFLQAEMELRGSSFVLHKMINQFGSPYIDFLAENLPAGSTVSINGLLFARSSVENIKKTLSAHNIHLNHRSDLMAEVWKNRPQIPASDIEIHDAKYTGMEVSEKLAAIRAGVSSAGAAYHLITALDDLAWTFNIRGRDVDFNPVVTCYAVIGSETSHFFVAEGRVGGKLKSVFNKNKVKVHDYGDIVPFLNNLREKDTILVDPAICSQAVYEAINGTVIHGGSIPKSLKAVKNKTEIAHIRNAMKKDGAALAHAFHWLEHQLSSGKTPSEVEVAHKLAECRSMQKLYQGESFSAIVGYRDNGAIIHYHPEAGKCKSIHPEGILLVDSGGQYTDGTTDITRTFTLGHTTEEQKRSYTLVLKGMIALSVARFPEGTTGMQLDTFARQFLWAEGMNYGHGTGHGVGFFLNVHEPPQGFTPAMSERGKTTHTAGMLTSNEPGFYKEGEYGIRIENLVVTTAAGIPGWLEFETVTLYPFDHALIDKSRLTKDEAKWINQYHARVYATVAPLLKGDLRAWFKNKCRKV